MDGNLQALSFFLTHKLLTKRVSNFLFEYGITGMVTLPFQDINLPNENIEPVFIEKPYFTYSVFGEIRYIINLKNEIFFRARYVSNGHQNSFNQIQIGYKAQIPIPSSKNK